VVVFEQQPFVYGVLEGTAAGGLESLAAFVITKAIENPRSVSRICFHESPESAVQIMLIGLAPNSSFPIHRHEFKEETLVFVGGSGFLIFHWKDGAFISSERTDFQKSSVNVVRRGRWHSLESRGDGLAFLEVAQGPFRQTDTIYSPGELE